MKQITLTELKELSKYRFIVRVTPDLVKRGLNANKIAKEIGKRLGGGGGGTAEKAEGGAILSK